MLREISHKEWRIILKRRKKHKVHIEASRAPYKQYLKSKLWKDTSKRIKKRDKNQCRVCGSKDKICVHHRNYLPETMMGLNDKALITLCNECHYTVGFTNNIKLSVYDQEDKLVIMLANPKTAD